MISRQTPKSHRCQFSRLYGFAGSWCRLNKPHAVSVGSSQSQHQKSLMLRGPPRQKMGKEGETLSVTGHGSLLLLSSSFPRLYLSSRQAGWMFLQQGSVEHHVFLSKRQTVDGRRCFSTNYHSCGWGEGRKEHFSPLSNSMELAADVSTTNTISPKIFPFSSIISLGIGRCALFAQSSARLEYLSCNLC